MNILLQKYRRIIFIIIHRTCRKNKQKNKKKLKPDYKTLTKYYKLIQNYRRRSPGQITVNRIQQ